LLNRVEDGHLGERSCRSGSSGSTTSGSFPAFPAAPVLQLLPVPRLIFHPASPAAPDEGDFDRRLSVNDAILGRFKLRVSLPAEDQAGMKPHRKSALRKYSFWDS
jgi:hypothetical protein